MYMVVLYFNNVIQCHEVDKGSLKCRYICSKNIGGFREVNSVGVRFTVLKQEGRHLLFVMATSVCYVFNITGEFGEGGEE